MMEVSIYAKAFTSEAAVKLRGIDFEKEFELYGVECSENGIDCDDKFLLQSYHFLVYDGRDESDSLLTFLCKLSCCGKQNPPSFGFGRKDINSCNKYHIKPALFKQLTGEP